MTYLVVGLDQSTFAPWHENIRADDVMTAKRIAFARAQARGIHLVVAAVIGPNSTVPDRPRGRAGDVVEGRLAARLRRDHATGRAQLEYWRARRSARHRAPRPW